LPNRGRRAGSHAPGVRRWRHGADVHGRSVASGEPPHPCAKGE
jgi:hypothetical protein